jgi:tRNA 2-thiouridine synthesizing protein A
LRCPLPVLKLEKALDQLASGTTLIILADDPVAKLDIPLFCRKLGHACTTSETSDAMRFTVVKSAKA